MQTLLLTVDTWDLCLDADNNIAVASEPYALAQDAASSVRCFLGEPWYNTKRGVPYFQTVFKPGASLPVVKNLLASNAAKVPDVSAAQVMISSLKDRVLSGQIQVAGPSGQAAALFSTTT